MQNKDILLIAPDCSGGMQTVVNNILNSKLGSRILYLPSFREGRILYRITFFINFLFKYLFLLLKKKAIKIVHIMVAKEGSIIRKAVTTFIAKALRKKTILHIHSCKENLLYNDSFFATKLFLSRFLDNNDLIIVLSNKWKEIISEKCKSKNVEVLYNPVYINNNAKSGNKNTINILYCGRLEWRKGYQDLIHAVQYIKSSSARFYLYGDGETKKAEELANTQHKQDIINIMGWQTGEALEKAYLEADIFVLPSYNEGLPMAILEAMSYGLPVISTLVGGIPELITNNINGFLIKPGDYRDLADKLNIMIENPALRNKIGEENLKKVRDNFSIDVIISQLENIYNKNNLIKD